MNVLGVILARGGSKRCPNKNLRNLGGRPLIAWTILAARHSMLLDQTVVSSDSEEILKVAQEYGVAALKRPAEMATDQATSYPPLLHAVDSYDKPFEWVCLLQPTSPFRTQVDIDLCIMMAFHGGLPAMASAEVEQSVPNGAVYVGRVEWLRECMAMGITHPFDGPSCGRYWMPSSRSLDINTEEDFALAEAMIERWAA